jgi:hypothetical protein
MTIRGDAALDGARLGDHIAGMEPASNPTPKPLSPAAARALAEAAERRAEQAKREEELARVAEKNGRGGPDPVRYGDWEAKGIASDF